MRPETIWAFGQGSLRKRGSGRDNFEYRVLVLPGVLCSAVAQCSLDKQCSVKEWPDGPPPNGTPAPYQRQPYALLMLLVSVKNRFKQYFVCR